MMRPTRTIAARSLMGAVFAAGLASVLSGPVHAQAGAKLTGEVFIAGKTPSDPPPNEPRLTHAYVTLEGAGALQMYQSMKVTAKEDLCLGNGAKIKRVGNLSCSVKADGKSATCDFSLDLNSGRTGAGKPC